MKKVSTCDIMETLALELLDEGLSELPLEPTEADLARFTKAFKKMQVAFEKDLLSDIQKALSSEEIYLVDTRIFFVDPQKQGSTYILTKVVLPNKMTIDVECVLFLNRIILSYHDRAILHNLNSFWLKRKLKNFDFNGDIFFTDLRKL